MKILYAIQGTGNGHLSRAMDIVPALRNHGTVDILVSGTQGDLKLPFPIKYQFKGLSFIFGKKGGVDLWKTFSHCNPRKLIRNIQELPVENYDLIINDFEPVSAWACLLKGKECVSLSHQAAVIHKDYPQPDTIDRKGKLILQQYAPTNFRYGFHFRGNGKNIFTPVVRKQVRDLEISDYGHYTVYLPSYDDKQLIAKLSAYNVRWDVFSKHNSKMMVHGNVTIQPIDNQKFMQSMASATGVLCGAGFETPAEALFLGKKLLVIPMKNQYEQELNAAAFKAMGVPVVKSLKEKYEPIISDWLLSEQKVKVNYPDMTQEIVDRVVAIHSPEYANLLSLPAQELL